MEIFGTKGTAKIATDLIDEASILQIEQLMNNPVSENAHVRIMPDVHAGAGCVIGTSMIVTDKVIPNLVGVDIGCGVDTVKFTTNASLKEIDEIVHKNVPCGFSIHSNNDRHHYGNYTIEKIYQILNSIIAPFDIDRAISSVGTLGGGNHFIEIDTNQNGETFISVHSGSRHLGVEIASFYQNEACKYCEANGIEVDKKMEFITGRALSNYLNDMINVQLYAQINRNSIIKLIFDGLINSGYSAEIDYDNYISSIHNYIECRSYADSSINILRKGAVAAYKDQQLVIPMNMKDGILICRGKGNSEWNYTAPHGAGRVLSRAKAKATLSVEDFEKEMSGIYSTCISKKTLDEAPGAYKPMNSIIESLTPMVDIEDILKPIYNFKG